MTGGEGAGRVRLYMTHERATLSSASCVWNVADGRCVMVGGLALLPISSWCRGDHKHGRRRPVMLCAFHLALQHTLRYATLYMGGGCMVVGGSAAALILAMSGKQMCAKQVASVTKRYQLSVNHVAFSIGHAQRWKQNVLYSTLNLTKDRASALLQLAGFQQSGTQRVLTFTPSVTAEVQQQVVFNKRWIKYICKMMATGLCWRATQGPYSA